VSAATRKARIAKTTAYDARRTVPEFNRRGSRRRATDTTTSKSSFSNACAG
jgi:hypothetical protein